MSGKEELPVALYLSRDFGEDKNVAWVVLKYTNNGVCDTTSSSFYSMASL